MNRVQIYINYMTSIGGKGEEDSKKFIAIDQQIYRFCIGKDANIRKRDLWDKSGRGSDYLK